MRRNILGAATQSYANLRSVIGSGAKNFSAAPGQLGPHKILAVPGPRQSSKAHLFGPVELFALDFFDRLWEQYRKRVSYVRTYEDVIQKHGATFVNDHIALRTIACQTPHLGISSISRIFEALGFQAAECYKFDDKHLSATYFQHPHPHFPKLFISELRSWELNQRSRGAIERSVASHKNLVPDSLLSDLMALRRGATPKPGLLEAALAPLQQLPWAPPELEDVKALNEESQYGAWVLVHGFNVNHFTALINSHGVAPLASIELTAAALAAEGVPMKREIEGGAGASLRQTATEAVVESVAVKDKGASASAPWTYAYFELAQRDPYRDADGTERRYEGFLSGQATSLFDMTRHK